MGHKIDHSQHAQQDAAAVREAVERAGRETEEFCIQLNAAAEARVEEIMAERKRVRQQERQGMSWLAYVFGWR